MFRIVRPLFLLFASSVVLVSFTKAPTASAQECNACLFDGNDPDSCIVYGKINDDIVEWNTGSRECKGFFDITISSIDPNASCHSVNSFINSLRFGDLEASDSKLGLGAGSDGGAFFVQNPDNNNLVEIAPAITINGETTNCETSEFNCYTKMSDYFENDEQGQKEKDQVCETLYNKIRVDRNLEESVLRNRLCMEIKDGSVIPLDCDPLTGQVSDAMEQYPDTDCSGYGFEAPLTNVPGCENALADNGASESDGSTSSSSTTSTTGSGSSSNSSSSANTVLNIASWNWLMTTSIVGALLGHFC